MSWAGLATSFLFAAAVTLASVAGVDFVMVLVAMAAALAALELSSASGKAGTKVIGYAVAAYSVSFPLAVRFRGESGFIEASAVAILAFGAIYVFKGLSPRVSAAMGSAVLFASLVGGLASYLVLLAARGDGQRLLLILGVLTTVPRGVSFALDRKFGQVWGHVAGAAATVVSGLVLGKVLGGGLSTPKLMILGAIVAGAAALSTLVGQMVKTQLSPNASLGSFFPAIEPLLLTAPAFYYGVKLYLS